MRAHDVIYSFGSFSFLVGLAFELEALAFGLAEADFGSPLALAGAFPPFTPVGAVEFSNIGPGSNNKVVQGHIRFRNIRTKPQDLFGGVGPVREMRKPISRSRCEETTSITDFKPLPWCTSCGQFSLLCF